MPATLVVHAIVEATGGQHFTFLRAGLGLLLLRAGHYSSTFLTANIVSVRRASLSTVYCFPTSAVQQSR
ncbi:hypothetical protein D3C71_2063560 [compost metagenome]